MDSACGRGIAAARRCLVLIRRLRRLATSYWERQSLQRRLVSLPLPQPKLPDFLILCTAMQRHTHVFTHALLHSSRAPLCNMCVRSRTRRGTLRTSCQPAGLRLLHSRKMLPGFRGDRSVALIRRMENFLPGLQEEQRRRTVGTSHTFSTMARTGGSAEVDRPVRTRRHYRPYRRRGGLLRPLLQRRLVASCLRISFAPSGFLCALCL